MLFYHVDHTSQLSVGSIVAPSFNHLASVNWSLDVCKSVRDTFPEKLSRFGARALLATEDADCAAMVAFDFILETVRLRSFPDLPSRLSSFFGMRDLPASFDKWKNRFGKDASSFRAFECESDIVYSVDASFLDYRGLGEPYREIPSRLELPRAEPRAWLAFPAFQIHAARQYWKSCVLLRENCLDRPACTAIPQAERNPPVLEELLVPGLVRVLREVPLP